MRSSPLSVDTLSILCILFYDMEIIDIARLKSGEVNLGVRSEYAASEGKQGLILASTC